MAQNSEAPFRDDFRDDPLTRRWVQWRGSHPVRAPGEVHFNGGPLPRKSAQHAWTVYTERDRNCGRLGQEWFLAPFLVPLSSAADPPTGVQPGEAGFSLEIVRASGGEQRRHYTGFFWVQALVPSHPSSCPWSITRRDRPWSITRSTRARGT